MMRMLLILGCLGFSLPLFAQSMVLDKVIAKIGNEYVLLSDLEDGYSLAKSKNAVPEGGRCTLLEELLVTNLLVHHARIDSMEVSEAEIEAQLEARIDQILRMMNNDIEQFESYYGMTIAETKESFRLSLRKQLNARRVQSSIVENIKVTPSEVIDYFNQIPKDSLPYFNSEVELSELIYKPKPNEEEINKAMEKAEMILERIRQGESFEELAKLYSDDRGSGSQGGALGRNARGTFVTEFEAVAYKLLKGEVSDIVETDFGYHIIRLNERFGDIIDVHHILIRPEITQSDLDSAKAFLLDIRRQIYDSTLTFVEAVRIHGDEMAQSYSNGGRMLNPKTGNTFFETADLQPDVFFAIDTLKVDEISGPIEFRTATRDIAYQLVWLNSRTPPHRASIERDYTKILNAAKQSKQNEAFNEWVDRKIDQTYIVVDQAFNTCENLQKWNLAKTEP